MHNRVILGFFFLAAITSSPRLLIAQSTNRLEALVIDDHDPRCQFEGGVRFDGVAREATVNDGITASQAADARVIWKPGVAGRYYIQVHWQTHMGYHERHALYTVKSADTNPRLHPAKRCWQRAGAHAGSGKAGRLAGRHREGLPPRRQPIRTFAGCGERRGTKSTGRSPPPRPRVGRRDSTSCRCCGRCEEDRTTGGIADRLGLSG